jgi:D-glycero-alpha-D-manno-heptose 1-phosphate guanylyltransferase
MNGLIAFLACGGAGSRVATVAPGVSKALLEVQGEPLLFRVVGFLRAQGVSRFCFGVSPRTPDILTAIRGHFGAALDFEAIHDSGTVENGGALAAYLAKTRYEHVLAINADTILQLDADAFFRFHVQGHWTATIAVSSRSDQPLCGNVLVLDGAVRCFAAVSVGEHCNTGWALFNRERSLRGDTFAFGSGKLEEKVYPALAARGELGAFDTGTAKLLDVGTPERLASANANGYDLEWFSERISR